MNGLTDLLVHVQPHLAGAPAALGALIDPLTPSPIAVTVLTGAIAIVCASVILLHEVVLTPDRPNYPSESTLVRLLMFVWGAFCLYRGVEIIAQGFSLGVYSTVAMTGSWAACLAAQGALLTYTLRSWLPVRQQRFVQRLKVMASCATRRKVRQARRSSDRAAGVTARSDSTSVVPAALVELQRQGVVVVPPGASLESWADLVDGAS